MTSSDILQNNDAIIAKLEALLFIHGEPLAVETIAEVIECTNREAADAIDAYRKVLAGEERGVMVVFDGSGKKVQLVTKPEFAGILERFVKKELREDLTPASLETLSIIAYLGPITRNKIEYLRGVNSSFILRNLLVRGLIERVPDPGRSGSAVYSVSTECLRYLGMSSQSDLPDAVALRLSFETAGHPDSELVSDAGKNQD